MIGTLNNDTLHSPIVINGIILDVPNSQVTQQYILFAYII